MEAQLGGIKSGAETQTKTAVYDDIHPTAATYFKQVKQRLRDIECKRPLQHQDQQC